MEKQRKSTKNLSGAIFFFDAFENMKKRLKLEPIDFDHGCEVPLEAFPMQCNKNRRGEQQNSPNKILKKFAKQNEKNSPNKMKKIRLTMEPPHVPDASPH